MTATFARRHDLDGQRADLDPIQSPGLRRFPFHLSLRKLEIDERPALPERGAEFLFQYMFPTLGPFSGPVQKALFRLLLACRTSLSG